MTKQQFTQLLDKLEEIYEQDNKEVKAWKGFVWVLTPTEYSPIPEGRLSTVLDVLWIEYLDIARWLSYYFFEAKGMMNPIVTDKGKNYNYSNKEDIIKSMIDFKYIK